VKKLKYVIFVENIKIKGGVGAAPTNIGDISDNNIMNGFLQDF